MDQLIGKKLAVLSNVHKVHDGRMFYRQAYFAMEKGMQVSMLAIDDGCQAATEKQHAFLAPKSRFHRFLLGWRLAYLAHRHGGDLCHFHDPEMLLPMTLFRLLSRKPVIYDCHENVVDSIHYKPHIPKLLRPALAKITFMVQWMCAKLIGSVVVATEEQLEMFPDSIQHLVVRNFPPLFIQKDIDFQAERQFDLVHCGTFSPERGSQVMLEMMRILVHDFGHADCKLLLLGVAETQIDASTRQFIRDHELSHNIVFQGAVPLHDVPQMLLQAKIGLMCHQETKQYRYGVASKLFDYMASGLAIVGGFADFDREYAPETSVKIFVDQTKPHKYAVAVNHLLEHEEVRVQMGQNARKLYEEKYTAELQADNLLQFYCDSIKAKAA